MRALHSDLQSGQVPAEIQQLTFICLMEKASSQGSGGVKDPFSPPARSALLVWIDDTEGGGGFFSSVNIFFNEKCLRNHTFDKNAGDLYFHRSCFLSWHSL